MIKKKNAINIFYEFSSFTFHLPYPVKHHIREKVNIRYFRFSLIANRSNRLIAVASSLIATRRQATNV
jgi:hypothetical protein